MPITPLEFEFESHQVKPNVCHLTVDSLTIGVADNVCFWVGLPQDPVAPGGNISPHLRRERESEEDSGVFIRKSHGKKKKRKISISEKRPVCKHTPVAFCFCQTYVSLEPRS